MFDMELLADLDFVDSFWNRVNTPDNWLYDDEQNPCWEWTGSRDQRGYGRVYLPNGKIEYAHRVAYVLNREEIPEGMIVRHICDNKPCCNPSHLAIGTHRDNAADRDKAGHNGTVGQTWGRRGKLTVDDVLEIKSSLLSGLCTIRGLAEVYGVSTTTIESIVSGKSWKGIGKIQNYRKNKWDIVKGREGHRPSDRPSNGDYVTLVDSFLVPVQVPKDSPYDIPLNSEESFALARSLEN